MWSSVVLKAFLWLFFLFILENVWNAFFFERTPSFLLIGVVFYALAEGPVFGLLIGCAAGAFLEIFSTGPLGLEMAVLGICGLLTGLFSSKLFGEGLLTQFLLPLLASFLAAFLNLLFMPLRVEEPPGLEIFKNTFVWSRALETALLSPFIFRLLKPRRRTQKERLSLFSR